MTLDQLAKQAATIASNHGCFGEAERPCCDRDDPLPLELWCPECVLGALAAAVQAQRRESEAAALKRLSDALADGNASTWDEVFHVAEQYKESFLAFKESYRIAKEQLEAQRDQLKVDRELLSPADAALLDRLRQPVDQGSFDGWAPDGLCVAAANRLEHVLASLGTEQTMHAAWRKRGEEAEAREEAQREQLEQAHDRLADIQELAKVLSLEDAVLQAAAGESETAMRLRLFEAIATLRG